MRRLAPFLLLALATTAMADSSAYLQLRSQYGVTQASGPSALRDIGTKSRVLEFSGRPHGTCQVDDTTILILEMANGQSVEVGTKAMPEWLANDESPVRVLVRAERGPDGLKTTLLGAAPEGDVDRAEEAYWRGLDAKRRAEERRVAAAHAPRTIASRGGDVRRGVPLYGPIGHAAPSRGFSVSLSQMAPYYAAFIRRQNPRLSPDKAMGIANDLIGYSLHYGVEPRLVVAILLVESGFDPNAVSHSGAVGLGQLMPDTARWMGVQNSYDTTQNLYGMIKLLNTHMRQFNRPADDPVVLAAYNAGEGAVRRHGGVPPYAETQAYVQRVTAYFHRLRGY